MRVAIYARVSTDDQTNQTQINELKRYCEMKGWSDLTTFQDEGVSGTKTSRPEFDKMIEAAQNKEFDVIAVWRFDRASRSTRHLLELLDSFQKWGVDFVSLKEQIDTSSAAGKLMFTMISAFAQFERDVISDRTKAAMKRLKSEGKQIGRERSIDYDRFIELKAEGYRPPEIAQKMGISKSHARKIYREAA